jgi:hypothetical protein
MKSYSTLLQDEFKRDKFIAVDLVEIYMVDENGNNDFIYLTNAGFDITWDNKTYTSQGDFLGFSNVSEDFDVKIGKFSIYLSAINVNLVNKLYGKDFEGRRVAIRKAFLDFDPMTLDIVDQPILVFDGIIYNIIITETAATASMQVECSTLWADFERTAGRKTNNQSNWLFQRGITRDTAFEQAGYVGNTEIKWGRE